MKAEFPYQVYWNEYRKRRNAPFLVFLIGGLVVNLFGFAATNYLPRSQIINVISMSLVLIWGVSAFFMLFRFNHWNCPECKDRFHRGSLWIKTPIMRSNCVNCGLQKYWGSSYFKYNIMKVKVLFFGATAETVGESEVELDIKEGTDSTTVLDYIFSEFPALSANHERESLHFSVNQEYSTGNEIISDGDELAVFTAVSGG